MEIIITLIIGAVVGWLASALVDSDNGGLLLDIIIGIVGGYLGYYLFGNKLSLTSSHLVNYIITATAGAAILAFGVKLIRRR